MGSCRKHTKPGQLGLSPSVIFGIQALNDNCNQISHGYRKGLFPDHTVYQNIRQPPVTFPPLLSTDSSFSQPDSCK